MLPILLAKRRFAVSSAVFARGRVEKTPIYANNPFLPAKKVGKKEYQVYIYGIFCEI
jgi:hypothetical protein